MIPSKSTKEITPQPSMEFSSKSAKYMHFIFTTELKIIKQFHRLRTKLKHSLNNEHTMIKNQKINATLQVKLKVVYKDLKDQLKVLEKNFS